MSCRSGLAIQSVLKGQGNSRIAADSPGKSRANQKVELKSSHAGQEDFPDSRKKTPFCSIAERRALVLSTSLGRLRQIGKPRKNPKVATVPKQEAI